MRYASLFSGIEMAALAFEPLGWRCAAVAEVDPFACAMLAFHHPDVPNLGDVSKITEEQIEALGEIDAIIMGFPCFPRGTLVLTRRGLVDISEVVVGDMVWTHCNRWRPVVKHHGSRMAETVRMRGHGGSVITTMNHRFYAASGSLVRLGRSRSTKSLSEPDWVEASDMEGMYWASPQKLDEVDAPIPYWVANRKAFFWAIGLWVADGWLVEFKRSGPSRANSLARRVHWCAAHHQADEVQRRLSEAGIMTTRVDERSVTKFVKQSMELAEYVAQFGRYAHGKTIPTWLLQASDVDKAAFLDGFLFGDGSKNGDGWKATTASKPLAIGIRLLATSLGWSVAAYLNERPNKCQIEGRECDQRDTWQLVGVPAGKVGNWRSRDGHFYGLVRHVDATGRVEEVFDIEVDEDHSFVADGMIVHNCQDVSHAGNRKGLRNDDGTPTRSGLFFDAMRLVRAAHARCGLRWLIGENVPGLFSSNGGRDFGTVIAEIVGCEFAVPADGWQNSGAATGPRGAVCWRTLDAQFSGLAQRRERVFFVADFGAGADRSPLFPLLESLPRDTPACVASRERPAARPARSARRPSIWEQIAAAFRAGTRARTAPVARTLGSVHGGADEHDAEAGRLIPEIAMSFESATEFLPQSSRVYSEHETAPALQAAGTRMGNRAPQIAREVTPLLETGKRAGKKGATKDGSGIGAPGDPMFTLGTDSRHGVALAYGGNDTSGPRDVAACLNAKGGASRMDFESETLIAHTLRGGGFDASEDTHGDAAIAFSCKDDGRDATVDLSPTMRSMTFDQSHANAGGQLAIAFNARQDPDTSGDVTHPLDTDAESIGIAFDTTQITSGENRCNPRAGDPCHPLSATAHPPAWATMYEVRRLTPVECERLMGVPDDYTNIPYRGRNDAPDGPRYKALGNGFAVPVVRWIGERIEMAMREQMEPA